MLHVVQNHWIGLYMYKYLLFSYDIFIIAKTSKGSHRPYNGRAQVKFQLLTFALYLSSYLDSSWFKIEIWRNWCSRPFSLLASDCRLSGLAQLRYNTHSLIELLTPMWLLIQDRCKIYGHLIFFQKTMRWPMVAFDDLHISLFWTKLNRR